MIKITIYTGPKCHLCDEMKIIINKVRKDINFELEEVNIESSNKLYIEFKLKIPVLFINNKIFAKFKLDEDKFRRKLESVAKTH